MIVACVRLNLIAGAVLHWLTGGDIFDDAGIKPRSPWSLLFPLGAKDELVYQTWPVVECL